MYISPNFEVIDEQDSTIITPMVGDNGVVDKYLVGEKMGGGKTPVLIEEDIDRSRMLLCPVDNLKSMWLYPDGSIKVER